MSHTLKTALQLYTIKTEVQNDYLNSLTQVARMGYAGVEFFNYGGYSAKELKGLLDGLGLQAANTHVSLDIFEAAPQREIAYAKELGLQDITIPRLPPERRKGKEDYLRFAQLLNELGEQCNKEGLRLHYHNHFYEFLPVGEMSGMEVIIANTNPQNVFMELDTFWAAFAGVEPIGFLQKNASRIRMIHLKDMSAEENSDGKFYSVEVGEGTLDIDGILRTAEAGGAEWAIVEQDSCPRGELASVKISIDHLKKTGWA